MPAYQRVNALCVCGSIDGRQGSAIAFHIYYACTTYTTCMYTYSISAYRGRCHAYMRVSVGGANVEMEAWLVWVLGAREARTCTLSK